MIDIEKSSIIKPNTIKCKTCLGKKMIYTPYQKFNQEHYKIICPICKGLGTIKVPFKDYDFTTEDNIKIKEILNNSFEEFKKTDLIWVDQEQK